MRFCPTTLTTARIGVLKTTLVVLLCAASGQRASGQQAVKLTLEEVLRLANQNNLDLAAARAKRAAALAGIAIAKERPNPTLTVGASRDLPHENVLLDQPFELGLKRAKRIEVARGESALNVIEIDILLPPQRQGLVQSRTPVRLERGQRRGVNRNQLGSIFHGQANELPQVPFVVQHLFQALDALGAE